MQLRKLNVAFCGFPYSGNGGGQSEHPAIRNWLVPTVVAAKRDQRIDRIIPLDEADTPIPMSRNNAVIRAKNSGADLLVMYDSDMHPDLLIGIDPVAKPFFASAFDFIYERYDSRKLVVAAPYCAGPPHENSMVLEWVNFRTGEIDEGYKLQLIDRGDAARRTGFENVGAVATGLIVYDLRIFDELPQPWFYYEYEGDGPTCSNCGCRGRGPQAKKVSTEDVTNTRDISLYFHERYGYNPIWVNWDAWAGHYKTKLVQKPNLMSVGDVGHTIREAVLRGYTSGHRTMIAGQDDASRLGTKVVVQKPSAQASPSQNGNGHAWTDEQIVSNRPTFSQAVPADEECVAVSEVNGEIQRLVRSEVVGVQVVGQRDCDK